MLLVAYDIAHDGRRDRVAGVLLRYGQRVQLSVFRLERGSAEEIARLLALHCNNNEDNIRIQPLCMACAAREVRLGVARAGELPAGYRVL